MTNQEMSKAYRKFISDRNGTRKIPDAIIFERLSALRIPHELKLALAHWKIDELPQLAAMSKRNSLIKILSVTRNAVISSILDRKPDTSTETPLDNHAIVLGALMQSNNGIYTKDLPQCNMALWIAFDRLRVKEILNNDTTELSEEVNGAVCNSLLFLLAKGESGTNIRQLLKTIGIPLDVYNCVKENLAGDMIRRVMNEDCSDNSIFTSTIPELRHADSQISQADYSI